MHLEIFLVGGAVRDFLLLRKKQFFISPEDEQHYWSTVEKDWVVVGATPDEMLAKGFRQVGKSFPVFLHPESHEEYALARTEKKVGKGYTGFETIATPSVTLEQDLLRRDLTINAIAMRVTDNDYSTDNIIDPHGGVADLDQKLFRHVSQAFIEDPVRILRLARFAARFGDFQVAPETLDLLKEMVALGEVDALVPERVWQEWARSLREDFPWRWFEILESCGAMAKLFPNVLNTVIKQSALQETKNEIARLAIELYDLHETSLLELGKTYRIPNEYLDLALLICKFYPQYLQPSWTPEVVLDFFEKTDAFRRGVRFHEFLAVSHIIAKSEKRSLPMIDFNTCLNKLQNIDNQSLLAKGFTGPLFAQELRRIRLEILEKEL